MAAVKHKRLNLKNLNPMFHRREKSEDNNELSKANIKEARKTGVLNLSSKGLATVPDKVWNLLTPEKDEIEVKFHVNKVSDEDLWWNQKPLTNLDLSSNSLSFIPSDIQNLYNLTTLSLHDNVLTTLPKEIGILEKLIKINLTHNKLVELPSEFFKLRELKYLNLSHNCFKEISPDVSYLYMLENLDLSYNQLTSLPEGIGFLARLTQLIVAYNKLKSLPGDIISLRSLQKLDVIHNDLENLPSFMGELRKLEFLYAQHNDIKDLPNFNGCDSLKEIHISNNFITNIPENFCDTLPQLKILDLRDNKIEKLPDEIAMLQSLIRLDLTNNSITSLPNSLATLAHLISLQLEGNPIRSIRRDIIQCGTTRILKTLKDRSQIQENEKEMSNSAFIGDDEISFPDKFKMRRTKSLIITMRNLTTVPDVVFKEAKEENVNHIDFSNNKLSEFPEGMKYMTTVATEIIIAKNVLTTVPVFISQFDKITYIELSKNLLSNLPNEFGLLSTLRELNISNNRFTEIPVCVYKLGNLEVFLARDNQIENIDATSNCLGALKRLATLDLTNNNISNIPPILGKLKNIRTLEIIGNRFRQPRQQILEKGTEAIMSYLRDRIPN